MLDVLYIIGFPLQLIREVFSRLHSSVVVDRHLPRFEALAYVLPHFDVLTHVVIRVSPAFIFETLFHKVNLPRCEARRQSLFQKVNLPRCELSSAAPFHHDG